MTYELKPCPKPPKSVKRVRVSQPRKGLQRRVRMKTHNAKRKGSAFPKQRDKAHCRWVVEETQCVGAGRFFKRRVTLGDVPGEYLNHNRASYHSGWWHNCWGPHDPAHVGKHRGTGAPDLGHVVNMCRALHDFYDQHRSAFVKATGLTERKLEQQAERNALRYVYLGGVPVLSGKETT